MCVLRFHIYSLFFFTASATTEIYTLSLHDALPISPQYLIWLVPLVALVRGRRGLAAAGLLAAACLMTLWWTPTRYGDYKNEFAWAWLVLGRDLVLIALFAVLAWPAGRLRREPRPVAVAPA